MLSEILYPLLFIFTIWCHHEKGVDVSTQIAPEPKVHKVNILCKKPEIQQRINE